MDVASLTFSVGAIIGAKVGGTDSTVPRSIAGINSATSMPGGGRTGAYNKSSDDTNTSVRQHSNTYSTKPVIQQANAAPMAGRRDSSGHDAHALLPVLHIPRAEHWLSNDRHKARNLQYPLTRKHRICNFERRHPGLAKKNSIKIEVVVSNPLCFPEKV